MRLQASGEILAPRGDFDEERIVVSGEHRTRVGSAAVEANAEAGGRAIGGNFSVVGREILFGIFGGDAALQRGAVERDVLLPRQGHRRVVERVTLRDENLRLDEVDAGDHFGDGVLDLDARVDLDEVPLLRVDVVEEFDGACVAVVGLASEAEPRLRTVRRECSDGRFAAGATSTTFWWRRCTEQSRS